MSHNGKGVSDLYARDKESTSTELKSESGRKRSRFDEVGELGRDSRDSRDSRDLRDNRDRRTEFKGDDRSIRDDRSTSTRDERSGSRDDRSTRDDRRSTREDRSSSRDDRGSRDDRRADYRDRTEDKTGGKSTDRTDRDSHDHRQRDDDRAKRHRDDRDYERDREYDRYRRERSEKYREDRYGRDDRSDRYNRGSRDRRGGGSVEIPFDRFLRLSPWRGPVTPLEERPRHLKNWDTAPAGFERISADKAKLTGLFPPPGNIAKTSNYVPPTLDPARAAMFQLLNRELSAVPAASSANVNVELSGNLAKQAKRFYVGNLPAGFNETRLIDFLESNLQGLANKSSESKVLNLNVSSDRSYAFVECRTAEDASLAMNLDGVVFEGIQLKVRRPKEYHLALTTGQLTNSSGSTSSASEQNTAMAQIDNSIVNKRQMIISGIPDILTSEHAKSLLLLITDLRTFLLLKDRESDKSLGVAVFEFVEDDEGEEWSGPLLKHSNGSLFMGPFEMKIQRICELVDSELKDILSVYNLQSGYATAPSSTPILQLLNIVTRESLLLDYDSIHVDLLAELQKHGEVAELVIPKPGDNLLVPGVGKVFVKYEKVEEAAKAAGELAGRIFDGHTCIVSFYPPEKFEQRLF